MKITLQKEKILNAIKAVRGIVSSRTAQPILSAILFETDGEDKIKLISTDLNLAMSFSTEAKVEKEGKFAINAKFAEDIITKLPDNKDVLIETDEEKKVIKIKSDKTKYEVVSLDADEYPNIFNSKKVTEAEIEEKVFEIDTKDLNKSIKQTAFSAVQTEASGVLGGICFTINDNTLEMVATDGNRLTRSRTAINSKGENASFICPYRTLTEISRLISLLPDKTVKFTIKGSKITFEFETMIFQSGLMDGNYPKYQQLIPTNNEKVAKIDREKFINTIDRISVMVNNRTNIMKFNFEKPDSLTISADTQEAGFGNEVLDVEYASDSLLIAFNYKYVIECLRNMSDSKIKIEMSTNLSAAVIKPDDTEEADVDDYLCLIMPVQVRQ